MTFARFLVRMFLFCALVALPAARAMAQPASVWDQIAKTKVLHVGLIPNRPPYQWTKGGKNVGLAITMGEDLAATLSKAMGEPIRIDYVTSTWATVVLDIQSGNVDVFFGMAATDERRKAINMFGPVYSVPVVAVNRSGFQPGNNSQTRRPRVSC
jgi:polar amino acid transport system substrate-binding protein